MEIAYNKNCFPEEKKISERIAEEKNGAVHTNRARKT